jgi:hypothetical protein
MNNYYTMSAAFDTKKNTQASLITGGFALMMILLMLFLKWKLPELPSIIPQAEYIEINLGVDDFGSGTDQPMNPGEPAPREEIAYTPASPVNAEVDNAKDIEEDVTEKEAPKILKPTVIKPEAKEINKENKTVKTTPKPVTVVAPPAPKPKALANRTLGGSGSGGNGADEYKKGTGEGITGGAGDQGRPGGSPTGTRYTGTPRNLGIRVVNMPSASFEDDFNESGVVALDISVDDNGKLISSSYQPRGSTISNRSQVDIAKRRATQIAYPKYEGGFKQTIKFDFKVKG